MTFAQQYGPWAVVAGASEGVGEAFAEAVAQQGINVVLLARRQGVLDDIADRIRSDTGADARAVAVDLAEPDAMTTVADATADVEVGLLMYCAGADANYQPFLANPVETALGMIHRNCAVPAQMAHHFAGPMAERGRGAVIIVGSGAGFAGAPNMAVYGASKAFDMVFAEGLWTELQPKGVDVLGLILGETDTPALRRLREQRGLPVEPGQPLPGAATVDEVVADALEHVGDGPTWVVGEQVYAGVRYLGTVSRKQAVGFMVAASADTMGSDA